MPSRAYGRGPDQSESLHVREIENGYLICRSKDGPRGYESTETFSPTKPTLTATQGKDDSRPGVSSLKAATHALRKQGK